MDIKSDQPESSLCSLLRTSACPPLCLARRSDHPAHPALGPSINRLSIHCRSAISANCHWGCCTIHSWTRCRNPNQLSWGMLLFTCVWAQRPTCFRVSSVHCNTLSTRVRFLSASPPLPLSLAQTFSGVCPLPSLFLYVRPFVCFFFENMIPKHIPNPPPTHCSGARDLREIARGANVGLPLRRRRSERGSALLLLRGGLRGHGSHGSRLRGRRERRGGGRGGRRGGRAPQEGEQVLHEEAVSEPGQTGRAGLAGGGGRIGKGGAVRWRGCFGGKRGRRRGMLHRRTRGDGVSEPMSRRGRRKGQRLGVFISSLEEETRGGQAHRMVSAGE